MKKKFEMIRGGFNRYTYEPYIVFVTTRRRLVYTLEQGHKDRCNDKHRSWQFLYRDLLEETARSPDWGVLNTENI